MEHESAVKAVEETIIREEYNKPGQEQYMSDVNGVNRTRSDEIDISTAVPVNNNVLIRCKKREKIKGLYMPSSTLKKDYEYIEIHAVSKKVKENQPEITVGRKCYVNMVIIKAVGGIPIHVEKVEDGEMEYYSVGAESILYLYDTV